MTENTARGTLLASLREKAEGILLISPHDKYGESVFCGEVDGEYVGWYPREDADAKGYNYRAPADNGLVALLNATDLAWAAVGVNYETSGEDIIGKQRLWAALADLEMALREIGYVA